jgi:hypothetical protein
LNTHHILLLISIKNNNYLNSVIISFVHNVQNFMIILNEQFTHFSKLCHLSHLCATPSILSNCINRLGIVIILSYAGRRGQIRSVFFFMQNWFTRFAHRTVYERWKSKASGRLHLAPYLPAEIVNSQLTRRTCMAADRVWKERFEINRRTVLAGGGGCYAFVKAMFNVLESRHARCHRFGEGHRELSKTRANEKGTRCRGDVRARLTVV